MRLHCDTDSLALQVNVTALASKYRLVPPKLEKAAPWWAQRKARHGEDTAVVLGCLAFGHGTSVATSQPLVAFCCPDCWQFDRLSWRALVLAARQQLSLHKLSFGGFDFVWAGFVAGQCPLSLAGSTQT
jgi:hypothetical protein